MMVQNTTEFSTGQLATTQHKLSVFAGLGAKFRTLMAAVIMLGFTSTASTAGTSQIDAANNLVTQMMVEVESILAQDINNEAKRTEKVSARSVNPTFRSPRRRMPLSSASMSAPFRRRVTLPSATASRSAIIRSSMS